jgi:hypothetical protein
MDCLTAFYQTTLQLIETQNALRQSSGFKQVSGLFNADLIPNELHYVEYECRNKTLRSRRATPVQTYGVINDVVTLTIEAPDAALRLTLSANSVLNVVTLGNGPTDYGVPKQKSIRAAKLRAGDMLPTVNPNINAKIVKVEHKKEDTQVFAFPLDLNNVVSYYGGVIINSGFD